MVAGPRDHLVLAQACLRILREHPDTLLYRPGRALWGWRMMTTKRGHVRAVVSIRGLIGFANMLASDSVLPEESYRLQDVGRSLASRLPVLTAGDSLFFRVSKDADDICGRLCLVVAIKGLPWSLSGSDVVACEEEPHEEVQSGELPLANDPIVYPPHIVWHGGQGPDEDPAIFYQRLLPMPSSLIPLDAAGHRARFKQWLQEVRQQERARLHFHGHAIPGWLQTDAGLDGVTESLLPYSEPRLMQENRRAPVQPEAKSEAVSTESTPQPTPLPPEDVGNELW